MLKKRPRAVLALVAAAVLASPVRGRTPSPQEGVDLTELSFEDLLSLKITSVAKKEQPWRDSAAAVHVITAEDLRRSGATTLPEALCRVPGLQVAQIDASKWAITSRGFNGQFANKLLVLIDGRSVYTPLFAGVFWEVQDTLLEDVERIEVIRGPGATLWGANAVNGVVNVITKNAADTQGGLLALGGGGEERGFATLRYGGRLGADTHYRVFGKGFDRDGSVNSFGADGGDDWDGLRAGFRVDRRRGSGSLTVSGELYDLEIGQTGALISFEPPFSQPLEGVIEGSGGHLLARWTRATSERSDWAFQVYYDRTEYRSATFGDVRDAFDVDFQHRFAAGEKHDVVWGLGYRFLSDELGETFFATFDPDREETHLFSGFIQDEIVLAPERFRLIVGSKLEHNDYTGFEIQPSVRGVWTPGPRQTLWASVARAVRTPSRVENDVRLTAAVAPQPGGTLGFVTLFGDRSIESESLVAYELGYRWQPTEELFVDLTGFYNDYTDVVALAPGFPFFEPSPPPPHLVIPLIAGNLLDAETSGLEASVVWHPGQGWRLTTGYTYLDMRLSSAPGIVPVSAEGDHPRHQASLTSSLDFGRRGEWDLMLQHVDELPNLGIPSYFRVDTRVGWRQAETLELSLVVRNAFDERHPEFASSLAGITILSEIERSVFAKLTWSF